jgi:hypothetical protein
MSTPADPLPARIFTIRGHRIILDSDLARLYGVQTFRLNEAVKRNAGKFPDDFRFQLTRDEVVDLISQNAISSAEDADDEPPDPMSSQIAMTSRKRARRYVPWAFTEHGALMAANVLRSPRATEMAIYVVRAFVKQREALASNAIILKRLAEIDKTLLEHDSGLRLLWHRLQPLLAPPVPPPEPSKRKIGYNVSNR